MQPDDVALLRAAAEGLQGGPWRGRCCQYHDGYRDGLDAAIGALSGRAPI